MIRHWLRRPFQRCRSARVKEKRRFSGVRVSGAPAPTSAPLVGGDTPADDPTSMRMLSPELVDLQAAELRRSRRGRR